MMATIETFNVNFSLVKFLQGVADEFDLHLFLNQKLTAQEEALIQTLDRWMVVTINKDEMDAIQPVFVNLALFSDPDVDPTLLYLKTIPNQFNTFVMQRKTHPNLDLIPIYDYDRVLGDAALITFRRTGVLPVNIMDILALEPPTLPYYAPQNQAVGFQVFNYTSPGEPDMSDIPYKVQWRITFRYFQPEHMMGSVDL